MSGYAWAVLTICLILALAWYRQIAAETGRRIWPWFLLLLVILSVDFIAACSALGGKA